MDVCGPFARRRLPRVHRSLGRLRDDFDSTVRFIPCHNGFAHNVFYAVVIGGGISVRRLGRLCASCCTRSSFARVAPSGVSLGRIIGAGGYLVRLRGRNSVLLVASYVSGLLGNADKRTMRGVGLLFGLRRAANLGLGTATC